MCIRDRVLDDLLFHRALEGAVEFLQRLAGAKAGAADPVLAAVGLARADLGGEQRLGCWRASVRSSVRCLCALRGAVGVALGRPGANGCVAEALLSTEGGSRES